MGPTRLPLLEGVDVTATVVGLGTASLAPLEDEAGAGALAGEAMGACAGAGALAGPRAAALARAVLRTTRRSRVASGSCAKQVQGQAQAGQGPQDGPVGCCAHEGAYWQLAKKVAAAADSVALACSFSISPVMQSDDSCVGTGRGTGWSAGGCRPVAAFLATAASQATWHKRWRHRRGLPSFVAPPC